MKLDLLKINSKQKIAPENWGRAKNTEYEQRNENREDECRRDVVRTLKLENDVSA